MTSLCVGQTGADFVPWSHSASTCSCGSREAGFLDRLDVLDECGGFGRGNEDDESLRSLGIRLTTQSAVEDGFMSCTETTRPRLLEATVIMS